MKEKRLVKILLSCALVVAVAGASVDEAVGDTVGAGGDPVTAAGDPPPDAQLPTAKTTTSSGAANGANLRRLGNILGPLDGVGGSGAEKPRRPSPG